MEILVFFAGIAFYYYKSIYPLIIPVVCLYFRPQHFKIILVFLSAILFGCLHDYIHSEAQELKSLTVINNAQVEGYVAAIPQTDINRTQIEFKIKKINNTDLKTTALLNCYRDCPQFKIGDYYKFSAKLKRPVNLNNPGGFDYVSWLHSKHIWWVGNIKSKTEILKLNENKSGYLVFSKIREYLNYKSLNMGFLDSNLGVFQALTIGVTHDIPKSQWELFRRTGTTHLIDISGEHIALIIAVTYFLLHFILTRIQYLPSNIPMQTFKGIGAIIVGGFYALISGFSVPTQRALISAFLMLIHTFLPKKLTIWQSWRYALLVVLLLEPHSVFMMGFYFSFLAVAILILINSRFKHKGILKVVVLQVACLFGLMPLSLYWFSYASISAFIANLIVIPLVGLLIVPIALILLLLSPLLVLSPFVGVENFLISLLLNILTYIDNFSFLNINFSFNRLLEPLCIMLGMLVLIFLPDKKLKSVALLLIFVSFLPHAPIIRRGDAQVDILDVGQGLSVLVRTKNHTLIYDTGNKFSENSDIAKSAIIPYLNRLSVKSLDMVVISHPDMDHRGGLQTLEKNYVINELVVDKPEFYGKGLNCHYYPQWSWDDVDFQFLPIKKKFKGKNNNSCILKISSAKGSVLLTGDIEKPAERYLTKKYSKQLKSDVLLIPHHESKTSSSKEFLLTVQPQFAVASYGFDNRYHFPHIPPQLRYDALGISVFNTYQHGMVTFSLNNVKKPKTYL